MNCFRKHTRQTGLVGSSISVSGFSRKGLSSSSLTKVRLGIFDGGKSIVDDDDDIDDMSLAFLFPKLLPEELVESGGFSLAGCVPRNRKGRI